MSRSLLVSRSDGSFGRHGIGRLVAPSSMRCHGALTKGFSQGWHLAEPSEAARLLLDVGVVVDTTQTGASSRGCANAGHRGALRHAAVEGSRSGSCAPVSSAAAARGVTAGTRARTAPLIAADWRRAGPAVCSGAGRRREYRPGRYCLHGRHIRTSGRRCGAAACSRSRAAYSRSDPRR